MATPPDAATAALARLFRQAFADANLTTAEAQELRQQLATFRQRGGNLAGLRQQLFGMARERFNTFADKAVIEWLEEASSLLLLPAAASAQVYFSPGPDCVQAIQRFIGAARHTLDVCVFTLADNRLTDAVLAAHERGVLVHLLTDNDKLLDRGSDVRQLWAAGVPVRVDRNQNHMHHKFAVADARTVLTGSYNWTRSAAELNLENLLITPDETVVRRYAQEFTRLWELMQEYRGHA